MAGPPTAPQLSKNPLMKEPPLEKRGQGELEIAIHS